MTETKRGAPQQFLWKPGQSGNKSGRKRGAFTKYDVKRIFIELATMTPLEMTLLSKDPDASVLEHWIASIMIKGVHYGDVARLKFILEAAFGKSFDLSPPTEEEKTGYVLIMEDLKKLKNEA